MLQGRRPCPPPPERGERAPPFLEPPGCARHRPEATLLYQLVERHYPAFRELRSAAGRTLPDYIEQEFDAYLKCGRLEEGFLRVRCETCHAEKLVAFSCKQRGFCPSCGALDDLLGHSITYRIAVGPRAGQKLFTLQTVPARLPEWLDDPNGAARAGGFSFHAGIDIAPGLLRDDLDESCATTKMRGW